MSQPIRPAIVVMLTNHPKTTLELLPKARYTSGVKIKLAATASHGVPNLFVFKNHLGAWPSSASPYKVRDARNMQELPQLKAEVQTTALMMLGRTLIPARWNAITNELCSAVPVEIPRFGSSYGTSKPTTKIETT